MRLKSVQFDVLCSTVVHSLTLHWQEVTGRTALHYAVRVGDAAAVAALLAVGANPNIRDSLGRTAVLACAVFIITDSLKGHYIPSYRGRTSAQSVLEMLLYAKLDTAVIDSTGMACFSVVLTRGLS